MERGDPKELLRKYIWKMGIPFVLSLIILPFVWHWSRYHNIISVYFAALVTIVAIVTGFFFLLIAIYAVGDKVTPILQKKIESMLKWIQDEKERSTGAMLILRSLSGIFIGGLVILFMVFLKKWFGESESAEPLFPRYIWIALIVLVGFQIISIALWFVGLRMRHKKKIKKPDEPTNGSIDGEND